MYGDRTAREMEEWHAAHNGEAGDPAWEAFVADFQAQIAIKAMELTEKHENDGRFGMSKAGGCSRASALKFLGYEAEPFSGSTRTTFFLGHICEAIVICTLRALGHDIAGAQQAARIDPFMHSFVDGTFTLDGKPTVLSVKSSSYKKSGKQGKGWVRRGFPELPFEGVRKAQPGWYAQCQAEMHALGYKQELVVVMSKDIIKAMEDDPYLGEKGNGSLAFYAELIPYNPSFLKNELLPVWAAQWDAVQAGKAGEARVLANEGGYVTLQKHSDEWQPNAGRTGTFNYCAYCDLKGACQSEAASQWRK